MHEEQEQEQVKDQEQEQEQEQEQVQEQEQPSVIPTSRGRSSMFCGMPRPVRNCAVSWEKLLQLCCRRSYLLRTLGGLLDNGGVGVIGWAGENGQQC